MPEQSRNVYSEMWSELHRTNHAASSKLLNVDKEIGFMEVHNHFSSLQPPDLLNLQNLSSRDRERLIRQGISPVLLRRNFGKSFGLHYFDKRAFQIWAVKHKSVRAVCPFTGRILSSGHSLVANINTIFYRFVSEQIFYVIVSGIGSGFKKNAIYFPDDELIVTLGDPWGFQQEEVAELKARMVSNFGLCRSYCYAGPNPMAPVAICLGFYHFGHHVWNELSGIQRLVSNRSLKRVDQFIVMREPLGALEHIFPEIQAKTINRKATADDIFREILEKRYLAIRVGANFIPRAVLERVNRVAKAHLSADTRREINAAKQQHRPLLWIGIRVGNRTWAGQAEGIARLISGLINGYPQLGVVFDGFSIPADRSEASEKVEYASIIDEENAVVDAVRRKLRDRDIQIVIFNIIGRTIFDAIEWAHAIDVYVSPFGTIQHKVGWFANKRGIIHSNLNLLGADFIWTLIEDAKTPNYVRASSVVDVPSGLTGETIYKSTNDRREIGTGVVAADRKVARNPEFNNYTIEGNALLEDVLALLESPAEKSTANIAIKRKLIERKLRHFLQNAVPKFDVKGL
jgi:hypothetical protein